MKQWGPQAVVAIILASGVMAALVMGSSTFRNLVIAGGGTPPSLEHMALQAKFWNDILMVILGALAGYIAGHNGGDK